MKENTIPTTHEIELVQEFVNYSVKRFDRLIDSNIAIDTSELPQDMKNLKESYIESIKYARNKMCDYFEDYKTGYIPHLLPMSAVVKER